MALYLYFSAYTPIEDGVGVPLRSPQRPYDWKIGDPKTLFPAFEKEAFSCFKVKATGEELTAILEDSKNLPNIGDQNHLVWYGNFAQFIAGNISNIFRNFSEESEV